MESKVEISTLVSTLTKSKNFDFEYLKHDIELFNKHEDTKNIASSYIDELKELKNKIVLADNGSVSRNLGIKKKRKKLAIYFK